jgi:drug/metabolite transporter (DMT)-like permease
LGFTLLAGLLFAGDLAVWNTAVLMTSAANATFIGNTAPVWVSLGAWLFFRERPKPLFWLGLLVALSGASLMLGGGAQANSQALMGGGLALIAGMFYAGFFLATRVARSGLSAFASWWISASVSAGALLISSLLLGQPLGGYSATTWLSLLGLALITQAGAYLLVNYALGHLPAPIVSTTLLLQPVATLLLAIPLLGEWPTKQDLVGGALVLAGIWVVNHFGK